MRAVVGDVEESVLVDVVLPGDAGAHVEQVLDEAAVPRRPDELGQMIGDGIAGRELSLADEHTAERAGQRLRDAHQEMTIVRSHPVEVALRDDGAVLQHDQRVGRRRREQAVEGVHLTEMGERERTQVALCARQLDACGTAADALSARNLRDAPERPAVVRRIEPVGSGHPQGDALVVDHHPKLPAAPAR